MDQYELLNNIKDLEAKSKQVSDELCIYNQHRSFQEKSEGYEPTVAILFHLAGYDNHRLENITDSALSKSVEREAYQRLHQYLNSNGMLVEENPSTKSGNMLFSCLPFPMNLEVLTREQKTQILTQLATKIKEDTGVLLFDLMWQNHTSVDQLDEFMYNNLFQHHRFLSFLGVQENVTYEIIE